MLSALSPQLQSGATPGCLCLAERLSSRAGTFVHTEHGRRGARSLPTSTVAAISLSPEQSAEKNLIAARGAQIVRVAQALGRPSARDNRSVASQPFHCSDRATGISESFGQVEFQVIADLSEQAAAPCRADQAGNPRPKCARMTPASRRRRFEPLRSATPPSGAQNANHSLQQVVQFSMSPLVQFRMSFDTVSGWLR